ncbi:hypothetical protein LTR37_004880 [Vermiconidia calcicola]|uniref:Uncharacterized protein n=1 Tax=Vermiconidia calcicola TaxID=1690605 RepID=A0ACC3NKQ7_9PEZI|nr:hypothetical protein LTR37_004880 [Vermiconidia calcicola]
MAMAKQDQGLAGHQVGSTAQRVRSKTDAMEEAEAEASGSSTGLLTAPREIRNGILKMVLIMCFDLYVERDWTFQGEDFEADEIRTYLDLSLVCHQLKDEAADIFFGENRFIFLLQFEPREDSKPSCRAYQTSHFPSVHL